MYEYYFAKPPGHTKLSYYNVEVSYGGVWISIEDGERFTMSSDSFASSVKSHRQIKAQSPVVGGDVLVHSVPDMVTETLKVQVTDTHQIGLAENLMLLEELFDQFSFNIRVTKDDLVETMRCQQAVSVTIEGGHVYAHNAMALATVQFARYPKMSRERI